MGTVSAQAYFTKGALTVAFVAGVILDHSSCREHAHGFNGVVQHMFLPLDEQLRLFRPNVRDVGRLQQLPE